MTAEPGPAMGLGTPRPPRPREAAGSGFRGRSERMPVLEMAKRSVGGSLAWQVAGGRTLLTGQSLADARLTGQPLAEELGCPRACLPESSPADELDLSISKT